MEQAADAIESAGDRYVEHANAQTLNEIESANEVEGVSALEMTKTYNSRMVGANSPGRPIYDSLLASPSEGRCPFCGHRVVSTLDHVLPKTLYPAFAVAPMNLVPCCSDCNKRKLDDDPATPIDVYIHPYFDNVEDGIWLKAQTIESSPAATEFYVDPCGHWDVPLGERLIRHFDRLALGKLYALEAANELSGIRYQLGLVYDVGGVNAVRTFLREIAVSCEAAKPNWWRSASYRAWEDSDWFCDGGFAEV
ncbi:HNH endonuclease [Ruegeria marisrubri]|uniref:HNH endonuclease n=1 Tax=Ruegeria marisrubri TaxID=1685379 RepID=UPI001CD7D1A2|nr:HNH endonuclease signature motif containing protein [Ruegeria marisrubri]MCA0906265.1 HNH endonuclease [Ruegeria marisrubri]